jgi:alpha-mannosidase
VYTDISKEPTGESASGPQLTSEERARLTPQQAAAVSRQRPHEQNWVKRIDLDGKVTGIFADYHYVGTSGIGGATQESTVKLLEAIVTKSETVLPSPPRSAFAMGEAPAAQPVGAPVKVGEGPVQVVESASDQIFKDITPAMSARLPQYKGDLELINHSAGSLTSQAYHKRWVLKNELLADAAKKTSIAAAWMGGRTYPQQRINDAWMLELAGHFTIPEPEPRLRVHTSSLGTMTSSSRINSQAF